MQPTAIAQFDCFSLPGWAPLSRFTVVISPVASGVFQQLVSGGHYRRVGLVPELAEASTASQRAEGRSSSLILLNSASLDDASVCSPVELIIRPLSVGLAALSLMIQIYLPTWVRLNESSRRSAVEWVRLNESSGTNPVEQIRLNESFWMSPVERVRLNESGWKSPVEGVRLNESGWRSPIGRVLYFLNFVTMLNYLT